MPVTLVFSGFYAAVSGNTGHTAVYRFCNGRQSNGTLNGDNIVMIEVSGLATSQDNNKNRK